MAEQITIKGMDKLLRKLKTVEELRGARRGLKAGALHVKGKISEYPPSTIANYEGNPTGRWYERGYGPKWARKDGSWGGRKTSETLGRKWTTAERNAGLTQVIGNNASYAPYVHDAEEQAKFHGDRGWLTDEEVLRNEGDEVLEFIQREVEKELS
jgi:hypothetical protein